MGIWSQLENAIVCILMITDKTPDNVEQILAIVGDIIRGKKKGTGTQL